MKTVLEFAGLKVEVNHIYPQFDNKPEYVCGDCETDFCVNITEEDISKEREISINEHKYEGLPYPDFTPDILENTAIYRKIADKLYRYGGFVFHGSAVAYKDRAYLFTAPSGTGKTTHTRLWLKNIKGSFVVNGDKPIIRVTENGKITVCGTPWAGKENMSENVCLPLAAICILNRGETNLITKADFSSAFPILLGQTHRPREKQALISTVKLLETVGKGVSLYKLFCNMEDEAAEVSFGGMCGER